MKHSIKFIVLSAVVVFGMNTMYSQNENDYTSQVEQSILSDVTDLPIQSENKCNVLGDLEGLYDGKCRKGLAHGKGTFKFADSDKIYVGMFRKGKMQGKGYVYTMNEGQREILKKGIWENNTYIGEKKILPHKVSQRLFVDDVDFKKRYDSGNSVYLNFTQNGGRNNTVSNVQILSSSGNEMRGHDIFGISNVTFPLTCHVTYDSANRFRTKRYKARLVFTINEPGVWQVDLKN